MESLAAAEAVPDHHLDEASLRGLQELRSARAERMKPLQAQLDALVLDLPPDLGARCLCIHSWPHSCLLRSRAEPAHGSHCGTTPIFVLSAYVNCKRTISLLATCSHHRLAASLNFG